MKYLCVLLLLVSCTKKEHDIIYVVESSAPVWIGYTNEFGSTAEEDVNLSKVNWRKDVRYDPKLTDRVDFHLRAFTKESGNNYLKLEMYVDKKLVSDTSIYTSDPGMSPDSLLSLDLQYIVDKEARAILSKSK